MAFRMLFVIAGILIFSAFKLSFSSSLESANTEVYVDQNQNKLMLITDDNGFPRVYYQDLFQYPCIDSVCERMQLRMYWDVWGHFLMLSLPNDQPLTKIGHEPFSVKDYQKLHQLLTNKHSNVQYFEMNALTDKQSEHTYYNMDAITGATIAEVSYETVRGAVKTCYSLWHIANDSVLLAKMVDHTTNAYNQLSTQEKEVLVLENELFKMAGLLQGSSVVSNEILLSFFDAKAISNLGYVNTFLELARSVNNIDKTTLKLLSAQLPILPPKSAVAIYNYFLQVDFKDKNVRKYVVKLFNR